MPKPKPAGSIGIDRSRDLSPVRLWRRPLTRGSRGDSSCGDGRGPYAIGTATSIGDMVEISRVILGRTRPTPAPCPIGLESPADGKNIIHGLIARGYSDEDVRKIAGGNVLAFFRRIMG